MAKCTPGNKQRTGTDPKDEFAGAVAELMDIIGGDPRMAPAEASRQGYHSIRELTDADKSHRTASSIRRLCLDQFGAGLLERTKVDREFWYRKARG